MNLGMVYNNILDFKKFMEKLLTFMVGGIKHGNQEGNHSVGPSKCGLWYIIYNGAFFGCLGQLIPVLPILVLTICFIFDPTLKGKE